MKKCSNYKLEIFIWMFVAIYFSFIVGCLVTLSYEFSYLIPVSISDFFKSLASLGTLGALALGFHQFKKSSLEKLQADLADEAKLQIESMVLVLDNMDETNPTIGGLNQICEKLIMCSQNVKVLYAQMNADGIQANIVRMRWQSMYFERLSKKFFQLNFKKIFDELDIHLDDKGEVVDLDEPWNAKYLFIKENFNGSEVETKKLLENKFAHLTGFVSTLYDNESPLFVDCFNRIDVKARAPLLAVLFEIMNFK